MSVRAETLWSGVTEFFEVPYQSVGQERLAQLPLTRIGTK
jgi:hypothetical protein